MIFHSLNGAGSIGERRTNVGKKNTCSFRLAPRRGAAAWRGDARRRAWRCVAPGRTARRHDVTVTDAVRDAPVVPRAFVLAEVEGQGVERRAGKDVESIERGASLWRRDVPSTRASLHPD